MVQPEMSIEPDFSRGTDGLLPASTGEVLMLAWMNSEAYAETLQTGYATYYSRSRKRLWRKGEESGHRQAVRDIRIDCDADTILLSVDQQGAACHEGYPTCFFRKRTEEGWQIDQTRLVDPATLYDKPKK